MFQSHRFFAQSIFTLLAAAALAAASEARAELIDLKPTQFGRVVAQQIDQHLPREVTIEYKGVRFAKAKKTGSRVNHFYVDSRNRQIRLSTSASYDVYGTIPGGLFGQAIEQKVGTVAFNVDWYSWGLDGAVGGASVNVGHAHGIVNQRSMYRFMGEFLRRQRGYLQRFVRDYENRRTQRRRQQQQHHHQQQQHHHHQQQHHHHHHQQQQSQVTATIMNLTPFPITYHLRAGNQVQTITLHGGRVARHRGPAGQLSLEVDASAEPGPQMEHFVLNRSGTYNFIDRNGILSLQHWN